MAIRVEVYKSGGVAGGLLARPGPLRDALASEQPLHLEQGAWQAFDDPAPMDTGTMVIALDDILFVIADDAPEIRIHASWHHVVLDSGPYRLEGELATVPGFDPGRSLARPSGEFVMLREVRLSLRDRPEAGTSVGDHALVNRYAVERIEADMLLGFIFPGAEFVSPKSAIDRLEIAPAAGGVA